MEALGSSLDLHTVLDRAYPELLRLVPAEYGALGVSATGRPEDYAWLVAEMPGAFFAAYPEMAAHDFVREAVARRPNVVLCDGDMLPRAALEDNVLYHRAREVGMPIEQVMAVMLHVDARWQSGIALYRERRRPFSEGERALLQRLVPALANTVRNCHLFREAAGRGDLLEQVLGAQGAAVVIVAPPVEVARTAPATALLDRWFAPVERRAGGLPDPLLALLHGADGAPVTWTRRRGDLGLTVTAVPLPASAGRGRWMISLREISEAAALPEAWARLLTPRESEIVARVLRGWDNRLIGEDLGCAEATVKKHLQRVFDKLGVPTRAALQARAARQ
jgi:DNA-binding CsgD family transcriptional regulator